MLKELEAKPRTGKTEQRIEALRHEVKSYRERGALQHDDPQSAALQIIGITDGRYVLTLLFAMLIEVGSAGVRNRNGRISRHWRMTKAE